MMKLLEVTTPENSRFSTHATLLLSIITNKKYEAGIWATHWRFGA
jgi:hypothetical protein